MLAHLLQQQRHDICVPLEGRQMHGSVARRALCIQQRSIGDQFLWNAKGICEQSYKGGGSRESVPSY